MTPNSPSMHMHVLLHSLGSCQRAAMLSVLPALGGIVHSITPWVLLLLLHASQGQRSLLLTLATFLFQISSFHPHRSLTIQDCLSQAKVAPHPHLPSLRRQPLTSAARICLHRLLASNSVAMAPTRRRITQQRASPSTTEADLILQIRDIDREVNAMTLARERAVDKLTQARSSAKVSTPATIVRKSNTDRRYRVREEQSRPNPALHRRQYGRVAAACNIRRMTQMRFTLKMSWRPTTTTSWMWHPCPNKCLLLLTLDAGGESRLRHRQFRCD